MKDIKLGNILVGDNQPPFIIAELSGNHNQSLDRALELITLAKNSGASAVKIQTYTAEEMTLNVKMPGFTITEPNSPWKGRGLFELYKEAYTPWEWHKAIFDKCKELGILCFSTPFDEAAVDLLEDLDCPFYKIASFENVHYRLIEKVVKTKKPLIISNGMASLSEFSETVERIRSYGCDDLIILKCTSNYPADPTDSNINTIPHLQRMYNTTIGLSDHTLGIGVALASVALGARVIEKHFTKDRKEGGVDSQFSLEPEEMKSLVSESLRAWQSLGKVQYGATTAETKSLQFRRSLYAVEDIEVGTVFTEKNIRAIRPGFGLAPKHEKVFLGKKSSKKLPKGTPISWDVL